MIPKENPEADQDIDVGIPEHETITVAAKADVDEEALDSIAEVHKRVKDSIAGFDKLIEKASPELKPVAHTLHALHKTHEAELSVYLSHAGRAPLEDGSFFATVNRAVIELRSWFDRISDNVMEAIIDGEKHNLEAYYAARDKAHAPEVQTMLARHIADIDDAILEHTA